MTKAVRRVLHATDLSSASRPAWAYAQQLGRLFDAEVLLLHVVPVVPVPLTAYLPWKLVEELREVAERKARVQLDTLLDGSTDSHPRHGEARISRAGGNRRLPPGPGGRRGDGGVPMAGRHAGVWGGGLAPSPDGRVAAIRPDGPHTIAAP
jgi:hypothetical protein